MANILQLKGAIVDGNLIIDLSILEKYALKDHEHVFPDEVSNAVNFDDAEGDPADVSLGAAADGTSTKAARRDHVHRLVDGAGLGLDADTVDGSHASAFAAASHTHDEGDLSGDLEVDENLSHRQDTTTRVRFFGASGDKVAIYAGGEAYLLIEGGATDTVSIGDTATAVALLTDVLIAKAGGQVNIASNLAVNGDPTLGSATGVIALRVGTAPTSSPANNVQLYAEDVAGSAELKVRDEAGNVTVLSPHDFSHIPGGPSEAMAWSFVSEKDGQVIAVDMLRVVRLLERLTGERLVWISSVDGRR